MERDADDEALKLWQDEALQLVRRYQLNPLRAARVLAYMHKAIYETDGESRRASEDVRCRLAAIHAVAARVLSRFFPHEPPGRLLAKARMHGTREGCPPGSPDGPVFARIDAQALRDGAFPPRRLRAAPRAGVGMWVATPPTFTTNPVEPYAGEWKAFFIGHPASLRLDPPEDPASERYREAVREIVSARLALTPEQRAAAEEWNLDAGSVTPPGVWNLKLRSLLGAQPVGARGLRLAAALNMAMHDAMVACWHFKFTYWTERPVTAASRLRVGAFEPLLVTPSFPGYPSGHACVSAAAAGVIAAYLPRHSSRVESWAREAAQSRFWGGIHLRFDNDAGLRVGEQVAKAAIAAMPPI